MTLEGLELKNKVFIYKTIDAIIIINLYIIT